MPVIQISGLCGQWAGIIAIAIGIYYEKKYHAHWGFVLLTAGSLCFAIGTKLLGF